MSTSMNDPHNISPGPVRRSLILAGGGMRVAYQAGVIKALFDSGLNFQHGDGTSGGTINLAMFLSGVGPDEMCERWRTLDVKRFASLMPIPEYLRPWDMAAVGSADGVREYVFPHLGIDCSKINRAGAMSGTFNVCNYSRKISEAVPHDQITLDLLVAGISLPIFMPAVRVNGDWYTDSVWIRDANLMEAVRRGSEELWLVWCIGNIKEYKPGVFHQYVHMIEMSANGKLFDEFQQIEELNARIRKGDSPYGQRAPIRLHVVRPLYPLPLDPDFLLGRITATTLIEMGYSDAKRYLEREMKSDGLPYVPEVTQMQDDGVGICFSETMSGGLTLGVTDPQAGHTQGEHAKTIFTMRATINVPDAAKFAADPQHQGQITGNVSYPAFGNNIPCKNGVFKLFSPTDDPRLKLMVYELGFEHSGKDYYMAGRKEVREDPVLDAWKQTTTLYTTLHEGRDSSGNIVGAGILQLGMAELINLVRTMHATNASTVEEKSHALTQFGRFFLRELWDSYVHHLNID
ncbi:MAG TPA: patatin-like phospholipase family protein [Verrucomicrobiae bacterium]|nr:patatin-like phospholipase family protein [Verrucomicrobiae bacterium]